MKVKMKIAVIGGGAAGFFAAINGARLYPAHTFVLLEKTGKWLSKVKVSGGGRCNVCHDCHRISELAKHYPRGGRFLKKAFHHFSTPDTIEWFESRGTGLKVEVDGRMFPVTDSSQTIIDCLQKEAHKHRVEIRSRTEVSEMQPLENGTWRLTLKNEAPFLADRVIVTTGGNPKMSGLQWLTDIGLAIAPPVPSLFTFNMPHEPIKQLMGLSLETVSIKIPNAKLASQGPLLITHWGMSGPAILKLSAWGARILQEKSYEFPIVVNWLGERKEPEVREGLASFRNSFPKRQLQNRNPFQLPQRLWEFLLDIPTKNETVLSSLFVKHIPQ